MGRHLQEEYLEWRVIRDDSERITRIEMTTELPDFWRSVAARDPGTTLNLVAQRAREASVPAQAVYGDLDPLAAEVSPEDRERAFARSMLAWGAGSPYNNGQKAICCMVHPMNTVEALIELVTRSAFPYAVEEPASGDVRSATSAEIIPLRNDPEAIRAGSPGLTGKLKAHCHTYVGSSKYRIPFGPDCPTLPVPGQPTSGDNGGAGA